MPLDDMTKTYVRHHLEYPLQGLYRMTASGMTLADGTAAYRYFTAYGALEWRMNNLMPVEESLITGNAYGAVAIMGTPQDGDQVSIVFTGGGLVSPVTVTATMAGAVSDINRNQLIMTQLLTLAILNDATMVAAGFQAAAPYGGGAFAQVFFPNPIVGFTNPAAFTIAVTATPRVGAQVQANGVKPAIQYVKNEQSPFEITYYGFVPILNQLESAQAGTSDNLDTAKADVWTARSTEIKERAQLYRVWKQKLGSYMDIPLGGTIYAIQAKLQGGGSMGRVIV